MAEFEAYPETFLKNISPRDWQNPKASKPYDLVIVGAGPGGMTAASVAKAGGAHVALVEKQHFGGECLSYGCIPSKAMLRSSRVTKTMQCAAEHGIEIQEGWKMNFRAMMRRVHDLQTTISPHDSASHFKNLGIDVFFGAGSFEGPNQLKVGNQILSFKKALIATGTQPIPLNVPGLDSADYLTNQNIFTLKTLPQRLCVIGAGPISCELAQAFLRFGSEVFLVTHGEHLLSKDDKVATGRLEKVFIQEGMKLIKSSNVIRVEKKGKEKWIYLDSQKEPIIADEMLVAIGRVPLVKGMDLEKGGIAFDLKKGITTNEYLQTTNPDVYAAGDVASPYKFTHLSKELCTMATANALNGNREKTTSLIIPWCTYTDPEIAHIGMSEEEAKKLKIPVETATVEMQTVDRAILDGETIGFAKLIVKEYSNQILGATLMAAHAGDMISEVSVAMQSDRGLLALLQAIHPFPTQTQVLRTTAETIMKNRKRAESTVYV